jgi:hypothetical protein
MKLETMPLLEWCFLGLLWGHFPCSLGLLDLDLAVVRRNNGAILPLERGNSDRLVDRCCWLSIKSELDRGFTFGVGCVSYLEVTSGSAMVGSSSWMSKIVIAVGMV